MKALFILGIVLLVLVLLSFVRLGAQVEYAASGGSDFTTKNQKPEEDNAFGGGGGAGMNLSPVAFLIVKGDTVKLLPVAPPPASTVDRVVEMVPDVIDKVTGFLEKQQDKGDKESF